MTKQTKRDKPLPKKKKATDISDDVSKVLELLPKDDPATRHSIAVALSHFSGPLPPPEIMEHYGRIIPDAPERILKMAEKEQSIRHRMRKEFAQFKRRGQWFALLIVLGALVTTYLLATAGHPGWGSAISFTAIAGIVASLIHSGKGKEKE